MLELKKGADILETVGGIATAADAQKLFEATLDSDNLAKAFPDHQQ